MALSQTTKDAIAAYLEKETLRFVRETPIALSKPYHTSLLPSISWSPVSDHSFATRTGTWFPNVAAIVARQYHPHVEHQYRLDGHMRSAAIAVRDDIVSKMDAAANRRRPSRQNDLADVLQHQGSGGQEQSWIVDFYLKREDDSEMFFELKTPQPNKSHCRDMKLMILTVMAMKKGSPAEAYGASGYNPYSPTGDRTPYLWGYTSQFLELGTDFLIAKDFWAKIAEPTTYGEVFAVAADVGAAIATQVDSILAAKRLAIAGGAAGAESESESG